MEKASFNGVLFEEGCYYLLIKDNFRIVFKLIRFEYYNDYNIMVIYINGVSIVYPYDPYELDRRRTVYVKYNSLFSDELLDWTKSYNKLQKTNKKVFYKNIRIFNKISVF